MVSGMVRQLAASGKHKGLNASKVGFTGFSAGGHLTAHISTAFGKRQYPRVDGADDLSCRPDFSIFMYPWMLLPKNKVPTWGAAYALASEFNGSTNGTAGITENHPVSLFIQNLDDTTAPPQVRSQRLPAPAQRLLVAC